MRLYLGVLPDSHRIPIRPHRWECFSILKKTTFFPLATLQQNPSSHVFEHPKIPLVIRSIFRVSCENFLPWKKQVLRFNISYILRLWRAFYADEQNFGVSKISKKKIFFKSFCNFFTIPFFPNSHFLPPLTTSFIF